MRAIKEFDIEAEEAICRGAIHNICFEEIFFSVDEKYFYNDIKENEGRSVLITQIIRLIKTLRNELYEIPTPDITRKNYQDLLNQKGDKDAYKKLAYFDRLVAQGQPTVVAVKDSIKRIINCYDDRVVSETINEAVDIFGETSGKEAMEYLREAIASRSRNLRDNIKISDYKESFSERFRIQQEAEAGNQVYERIPFGIQGLDLATGGAGRGELIILVAPPEGAKSLTMQQIALNMVRQGKRCAFFTKEMSKIEIGFRFDAGVSEVPHPKFFEYQLEETDYSIWKTSVAAMPDNHLKVIEFVKDFTVEEVEKALDSLSWTFKPDAIFLDYLGLMRPSGDRKGFRVLGHEKYDIVCREIKDIARERDLRVITASQLKTGAKEKTEVDFDDIFVGKNTLVQNADVVAAILSNEYYKILGMAMLQILKVRGKTPEKKIYRMYPDLDRIKIDTGIMPEYMDIEPIQVPQQEKQSGVNVRN